MRNKDLPIENLPTYLAGAFLRKPIMQNPRGAKTPNTTINGPRMRVLSASQEMKPPTITANITGGLAMMNDSSWENPRLSLRMMGRKSMKLYPPMAPAMYMNELDIDFSLYGLARNR